MRKNIFIFLISLLTANFVSAQNTFNIADQGTHEFSCFSDSIIVFDSGGENGNYGPDETYEITFCIAVAGDVEVVISPGLFGDTWDIDSGSFLTVHNGNSSAAPQIGGGMFNSVNDPGGILVQTNGSGCITLVFSSGSSSSGAGFTAHIRCKTAFQPFFVELTAEPEFQVTTVDSLSIAVCFADSFTVEAFTDYPLSDASGNGYQQSDATSYFNWAMGDGTNLAGFGLTEITYAYASGSGHEINLSIIDVSGTIQYNQFYVLQSPRPDFSNVALDDTLCIGSETVISGGINFFTQDTVGVGPGSGAILGGGSVGGQEEVYDADANCSRLIIPLEITEFEEGQTLTDIDDLLNICFNMHHTYVGDLEMGLVCPGSTDTLALFDMRDVMGQCFPDLFEGGLDGGAVDLGEPPGGGLAGVGYDYCFNNDPEFGTFSDVNPTAGATMPEGTYEANGDLNSLLGCPLNGTWQLVLLDGFGGDVGVLNSWSLFFNPDINPSTAYYSPEIVSAGWDENPDLIVNDDSTSVTVAPSQEGNNSFTFFAYDEFGCRHDTTINIYVRPEVNVDDGIACDLTHILSAIDDLGNSVSSGVYEVTSTPTNTADLTFTQLGGSTYTADANEYGIYTVLFTEDFCAYTDVAEIDYRPDPVVAPLFSDTTLCIGASIDLDAGPQEANSDNFNVIWTRDGGAFNNGDYLVNVDETGQYIVIVSGVCGFATDTTNVIAISLDFEGKTVCGLQSAANAELNPEGPGNWSGPDNISFSNANLLNTQISSSVYGTYPITYTDNRCVEDGITHDFTFVEQPEAVIIPANPDFCIDLEELILTATVSGSFNGTYIWSVNGTQELSQNDSLFFPPESFDPLEDYLISVLVQDDFSVCPLATGEANFTGKWCTYNIPNVVTPNGDNKNDKFHVEFIEYFPNTKLRVYDRWGKMVFEQANYDQYQASKGGWDPIDVSSGTYFFELLIPYVEKMETGYIEVLKEGSGD